MSLGAAMVHLGWTKTRYHQVYCSQLYIRRCFPLPQQVSTVSPKKSFTAGNMENLISVAVTILLVITVVHSNGFQFGDIISYPPVCVGKIRYKHFAVYVGDRNIPGKNTGEDIFERLKDPSLKPTCIFSRLKMEHRPEVTNYLDGYTDRHGRKYKKGSDEEIIARITEKHHRCGLYGALDNNCEHLATYVRYGVKVALQFDLSAEGKCINLGINTRDMSQYLREPKDCSLGLNG